MSESDIIHETANLYAAKRPRGRGIEIRLHSGTHSLVVGVAADIETARRFMARAERYPARLRQFMGAP